MANVTRRDELQQGLAASRGRLLSLIAGITEEQFKRRPGPISNDPEPWSIAEILAHLLWQELMWSGRLGLTLQEEHPEISPSPPELHREEAAKGRRAPVPQLIHGLLASRRAAEKSLAAIEDASLDRKAWHPRLGENLTVEWMVRKMIDHENEHCAQIEGLRQWLGVALVAAKDAK